MERIILAAPGKRLRHGRPEADALYVRFRRGKVAKTIHEQRGGILLAVDYNSSNEILGVECVGGELKSLNLVLNVAGLRTKDLPDLQIKTLEHAQS